MNPAFIATQLGHGVQTLLSTYARRINSGTDRCEFGTLEISLIGAQLVRK
jgi:integrase